MNRKKWINVCLLLTSLIGYLEWGTGNHAFVVEVEAVLFLRNAGSHDALLHPVVIIPFCGQLILLFTLFQRTPARILTWIGLACLSTIMLLLFLAGLLSFNWKIIVSAMPFIITGILALKYNRKQRVARI